MVENIYIDFSSLANQLLHSQLNFLLEFGPGWLELSNITSIRHDFPTISFDYSLAKTLDNEDILYKALSFGIIRTIYILGLDIFKFFLPTLNIALYILKPAPLTINFCFIPPRPQIVNKTKTGVILVAYHVIFICERAKKFKRRIYHDKRNFSAKDIYKRTHGIAVFYE